MRAAVLEVVGRPLVLQDVAVPQIGEGEVLVEIKACGICFTDLKIVDSLAATTPLIPGHEPVGTVCETTPGVRGIGVGDRVGVHSLFTCGVCEQCLAGEEEACVRGIGALAGLSHHGGYAEFMKVPASNLVRLPDGLAFAEAAPLFCAGLTSFAALRNGGFRPGQRVAVIGIGGLGHLAISIVTAMGGEVYAVTSSPDKAAVAAERGAVFVGNSSAVADELARVGGAHVVLNTSDSLDAVVALLPGMAKRGSIVLAAGTGAYLPIPLGAFNQYQLRVVGSFFGSRRDLKELLALAERYHIRPQVERYALADVHRAQARVRSNDVRFRAVLEM